MHFTSSTPCRNHVNKDVWGFMVLSAIIFLNWTNIREIPVGIFQTWRKWSLTKSTSQVVWKEAKELTKSRGENMKPHQKTYCWHKKKVVYIV